MSDEINNKLFAVSKQLDLKLIQQNTPVTAIGLNRGKYVNKNYYQNYRTNTFHTHIQPVVNDLRMPQKLRKARKPYWFQQTPFGVARAIDETELRLLGNSVWIQRCKSIIIDETLSADFELIPSDEHDFSPETTRLINVVNTFFKATNREGQSLKEMLRPFMNDVLDLGFGVMTKGFHQSAYRQIDAGGRRSQAFETEMPQVMHWSYIPSQTPEGLLRAVETHDAATFFKQPDEFGNTLGWWQYLSDGIPEFFGNREIASMMMYETSYSPYGVSIVESIREMTNVLIKSVSNTEEYMDKGAIPPGFLALSEISENEFELFESRWKATVAGNPTDIPLISAYSGKIEFQPLVVNTADIKQLDTIELYQKIVMSAFHVTPAELGITDAVNKSSAEQQSAVQKRSAIFPFLNKLEDIINRYILREFDPYSKIKFKWIKPTTITEQTAEWTLTQQKMDAGVLTINQYLKSIGQPIVAWGNVPFSMPLWTSLAQQLDPVLFGFKEQHEDQSKAKIDFAQRQVMHLLEQMQYGLNNNKDATPTMVSVLTRLRLLNEKLNMPGALSLPPSSIIETENAIDSASRNQEFNTTEEVFNYFKQENTDDGQSAQEALDKLKDLTVKKGLKSNVGTIVDFFRLNQDNLTILNRMDDLKYQKKYRRAFSPMENTFKKGMKFVLGNWLGRILNVFNVLPKNAMTTFGLGELMDYAIGESKRVMTRAEFKPVLKESITNAYRKGISMNNNARVVKNNIKFEKADPNAMEWLDARTLNLADQFINRYSDGIKQRVQEGFDRGLSIPHLVDSMKEVIPTQKKRGETKEEFKRRQKRFDNQLTRIARTEVNMAGNRGRLEQLRKLGATKWRHHTFFDSRNKDEKPVLIAGKKVTCRTQHGKEYNINDNRFLSPLHPNCRCTIHGVWPSKKMITQKNIASIKKTPSAMETSDIIAEAEETSNPNRRNSLLAELEKRRRNGENVQVADAEEAGRDKKTKAKLKKEKETFDKQQKLAERPPKKKLKPLPPVIDEEAEQRQNDADKIMEDQHEDVGKPLELMAPEFNEMTPQERNKYLFDRLDSALDVGENLREVAFVEEEEEIEEKSITTTEAVPFIPTFIDKVEVKLSKKEVNYVSNFPVIGRRCFDCVNVLPNELCKLVEGRILTSGHCKLWSNSRD